ncbi:ATP synthase subunit delta, mitochondrial [Trichonephila inaurata madagascariensis]|uniref:ATP synthase subunit delta, mitochondrial n=1 Tax=Trichonephila inaurata madagascariensis TaxID=2747483 RepID=A0A8X6XX49_9ARAC|nr:ATP synthase subunit delta, mitochondrial [Trichonephila inaurata madagascariensis]
MANKLFSSRTFNSAFRFATYSKVLHRNYASEMSFTFASPSEVFYEKANVKQVDVPSYSGSFGILADHVPTLAVLKPGVVTVFENDGAAKKFFGTIIFKFIIYINSIVFYKVL